jgi:hypothetical protein
VHRSNEELHNMSLSSRIMWVVRSRRTIWVGHETSMGRGEKKDVGFQILVGKPKVKKQFQWPRRKMNHIDIGWEGRDLIVFIQNKNSKRQRILIFHKGEQFLYYQRDCYILKRAYEPWRHLKFSYRA